MTSRQLLLDRGEIDPDILARNVAGLGEFEDVEQAEFESPVPALDPERPPRRAAAPDRIVDHEILAVQAARGADLAVGQVGEQCFVKRPRAFAAMCRAHWPADD